MSTSFWGADGKPLGQPLSSEPVVPITIRAINKQIKVLAYRAGIRGKRISTHTWRKTFGREVWKRNKYSEASLIKLSLLFNHSSTALNAPTSQSPEPLAFANTQTNPVLHTYPPPLL